MVDQLHLAPNAPGPLLEGPNLAQRVGEPREPGLGEGASDLHGALGYQVDGLLHPGAGVSTRYAADAVRDLGSPAHHPVVAPEVDDGAERPEVRRRVHERHAELLDSGDHTRREPLEVLGVNDLRNYLPHVLASPTRHDLVLVIQAVGAGDALPGTAHPAHRYAPELIVFDLSGLDVVAWDAPLGGEHVRFVAPRLELLRQRERDGLYASVVLGEELVCGEEDPHALPVIRLLVPELHKPSSCQLFVEVSITLREDVPPVAGDALPEERGRILLALPAARGPLEAARPQAALYDAVLATCPEELENPPENGRRVEKEVFVPDLQVSLAVEGSPIVAAFPRPVLPPAGQLGQPLLRKDRTPLRQEPLPIFGVIVADAKLFRREVEDAPLPVSGQPPPVVHRRDRHIPAVPDDVDYPGVGVDLVYLVQVLGVLGALVPHYPASRAGHLF